MFFQTQREAAGYIASKLADTRKEAVKVSLPLRELNTAPPAWNDPGSRSAAALLPGGTDYGDLRVEKQKIRQCSG